MGKGRVMASDDAKQHDESGRSAPREQGHGEQQQPAQDDSGFGPPLAEFGPPVDTFGGSAFGPPTADSGPGWSPADAPARPTLGWQPADAPTYRAPDSMQPPKPPMPAPDPAPPTARYTDTPPSDDATERVDRETWWRASPQSFPPIPPRESTGSLWDDDELAKKLMPPRPVAPPDEPEKPRRNKGMLIGGAVAAVVVIAGLVTTVVMVSGGNKPAPPAGPTTPALIAVNCPARTDGNVTTGNGPGDTSSGVGAILGLQHSYYADRSATKAHTFVTPDVNLLPADALQKTIDQIPPRTNYCLRIETTSPDHFNVAITEYHPDGSSQVYRQNVTTATRDGRTLVQEILTS